MSKLNRIQNEIKQLEGGRFQNLCDVYLYRKLDWKNIVSLGSMEGTDKTTIGIPDSYFFDEKSRKYILVMYGTRKDATKKLKEDIVEAIEKTKIAKEDIREIICCHTSSNISVEKDKELRNLANPIELTLIGIDTLSNDLLQFRYQDIVKDFLGIAESTEQVWNIEQFVSIHDKSKMNAPLNIKYIDENNTIETLIEELNNHQILLLSGVPGTGKTRLAIELCQKLPADSNKICVKSNSLPVYQDIKDALDDTRINYLLLDDGNTITNFKAIISLLKLEEFTQKLKLIITVREYAVSTITEHLKSFLVKIVKVLPMTDKQIETLVNSISNISSSNLRKIKKLSHNNPRIAVIAAIMIKEEKYNFVDEGKEILETYYSDIINENNLSEKEKISLFILSFLNKVNLTKPESLTDLLDFFNLDFEKFIELSNQLHDKELCDIFQDKAVRVSDQSLSDFIVIEFIVNKKLYKVRTFFIKLFPKYKKEIVEMLLRINNFKLSDNWIEYLTEEIKYVYNEILDESSKSLFLEQYGGLIPIETLAFIYEQIQSVERVDFKISQKEFEEKKNHVSVSDSIINILCTLSNSDKFNEAGLLLIEYFKKRPDKIYEVFSAIKLNYDFEYNWNDYFEKRVSILKILSDQESINEEMALLIVNVSEYFLEFSVEKVTSEGRNGVFTRYTLVDGDYLVQHHESIFNVLRKIHTLEFKEVNNYIDKMLLNYPVYEVKNNFLKTVSADLNCIGNNFFINLENLTLREEAIVSKLSQEARTQKIAIQPFSEYEVSNEQRIYNVFSSNMLEFNESEFNYEESQKNRIEKLNEFYREYSNRLLLLFNVLSDYQLDELLNKFEIQESVFLLYSELKIEEKIIFLTELLNSKFDTNNYHYDYFMEKLSYQEGKKVLDNVKKDVDVGWFFSNLLASKEIDEGMIEALKLLLNDITNDKKLNSFDILSFENYVEIDKEILNILLNKYFNDNISEIFFIPSYLNEEKTDKIIDIIGFERLQAIYINSIATKKIDKSGDLFKELLKQSDADFIYSFLIKLHNERSSLYSVDYSRHLKSLWESPVAEEGIKRYLDFLIKENRVIYVGVDPYLKGIIKADTERTKEFIKNEINQIDEEDKLIELYNLSLLIFDDTILLELFLLLKEKKVSAHFIQKLHLTMRMNSWSGSLVPLLDKEINFLNKLLDIFSEVEYIPHSLIIKQQIDSLKKQKENELLSDYLE
ncbi:nSTAND3 domain-containing NTPase [Vagococcus fluvialis]|uniref:nSTAND3 domain-containing NTPase n=1 Tax=Vagococcus fluvialis TaxID=2738 RepID=UPI0037B3DB07